LGAGHVFVLGYVMNAFLSYRWDSWHWCKRL